MAALSLAGFTLRPPANDPSLKLTILANRERRDHLEFEESIRLSAVGHVAR